MNAVLVRDLPERMAEYARLIQGMDTRPRLIEIEVTIMDIGNDSLDRLGVDWRAHGSRIDLQKGNGGVSPLTWNSAATVGGQTGATTEPMTRFRDFTFSASAFRSSSEASMSTWGAKRKRTQA